MKHVLMLVSVLLAGAALSSGQDEDFSKVKIRVTKVASSVYMLEGEGGNIAASVGEDGIVFRIEWGLRSGEVVGGAGPGVRVRERHLRGALGAGPPHLPGRRLDDERDGRAP